MGEGCPIPQCLWVFLLLGGWLLPCVDGAHGEAKTFIGWKGEAYEPDVLWYPTRKQGGDHGREWVELLSWSPRAFVYHNLLNDEECDHLREIAVAKRRRLSFIFSDKSEAIGIGMRGGNGTSLSRARDNVVAKVHTKLAEWLGVPTMHHEDMQVSEKQFHFKDNNSPVKASLNIKSIEAHDENPAIATVLLFLSSVESGGETVFPDANWADPKQKERNGPWSSCANGHVAVRPRKGDALLFFSVWPNGRYDKHSLHHDCPAQEGSRWTGSVQVHAHPLQMEVPNGVLEKLSSDPSGCEDRNPMCSAWAAEGWCKSKEKFMVGDMVAGGNLGVCRLACKTCKVCAPSDKECLKQIKRLSGYPDIPVLMDANRLSRPRHASTNNELQS